MRMLAPLTVVSCVLMTVGAFAAATHPGWFVPAPLGSYLLDLDVPDGRTSLWRLDNVGLSNAVRAVVRVSRASVAEKRPEFTISLEGGDERVTIVFRAPARSAPPTDKADASAAPEPAEAVDDGGALTATMVHETAGKDAGGGGTFDVPLKVGQTFNIVIDWTPQGVVRATLNGKESLSANMAGSVRQLVVRAASGEIEFNPLQVGQTGH